MPSMRLIVELAPFRLEIDDLGSIKEASELLANEDTELARQFDENFLPSGSPSTDVPAATGAAPAETPARRGRKPKNQPDPATAQAPAPIPAPTAPALAQQVADATSGEDGLKIPAFLNRTGAAPAVPPAPAAVAAPPPPVPPAAAPPIAPTPPVSTLAPKIIENLNARKANSADGGKSLADWLAQCGITVPNMTYDEAIASLPFVEDAKLQPLMANLGIS